MKSRRKEIAVLIPCYNEEKTVGKVVEDCKKFLKSCREFHTTVYVYDNNSVDKTVAIAQKAGAVVRRECRQGKGNVIRTMFREINADCYLIVDGDDTYPLEEAPVLCRRVLYDNVDLVMGNRLNYYKENKRLFHGIGNRVVRLLINVIFKSHIQDMLTGYRAVSFDFAKTYPVLARGFDVEVEMTIFALGHNFNINEVPIKYRNRPNGSKSKLNTYSDGFRVIKRIMQLFEEYKPAAFFSLMSLLFFIISLAFGIPVFQEYFETGLVYRLPTLVFAGFLMMVAVLMLICGIILEVVAKKSRQAFELDLNNLKLDH